MELFVAYFPYLGLFLLLILGGIGLPFPEDLTLILAGHLALTENLNLPLLLVICFLGVVSMDIVLFHIGRKYGRAVVTRRFVRNMYTPPRRKLVKKIFHKMGDKAVFVARFVGGFRAPVFITAGTLKMSYLEFIFLDVLGAVLSVPIFVLGSYYIGQQFEALIHGVAAKIIMCIMGVMTLVFLYVIFKWYRDFRKKKKRSHRG